jgi:hypothetical protein
MSMNFADVIAEMFVQPRYAAIRKTPLKRPESAKTSADASEGLEDAINFTHPTAGSN